MPRSPHPYARVDRSLRIGGRLVRNRSVILIVFAGTVSISACTGVASSGNTPAAGGGRGGRGRVGDGGAAPVVTAKVTDKDVPIDVAAIGNVEASTTISVRSQVTGQLQEALFHEGDFVHKGQELFTIARRQFEAAVTQAEAN